MSPRTPAHQLYYGPLYARDYFDRNLAHITSTNPKTVATMRERYGRYLAGFGGEDMSGQVGYDPAYQGRHIYDLEKEDDTFGSGIFDPGGRGGTSNANMGIFAGHYSLPGYAARDVPFTISRDVTDITDDAAVVSVPAGGMAYVEDQGRLSGAAGPGPSWRPAIEPAGYTRYDQPYVDMEGNPVALEGFGQLPRRRLQSKPPRVPGAVMSVPTNRVGPHSVPKLPAESPVGFRQIVHARQTPVGVNRAPSPVAASAPDMPMMPGVPLVSTTNVAMQKLPISGFGESVPAGQYYARVRTTGPRFNPVSQELRRARSYNVFHRGGMGQAGGGPRGSLFGDEPPEGEPPVPNGGTTNGNGNGTTTPEPQAKPTTAVEIAMWGLLAGAGVGLVATVVSRKKRGV